MTRNTTKRVEVAAPVWDKAIKERIMDMFHLMLKDNVKARELGSDGNYSRVTDSDVKLNSQEYFFAMSYQQAENTEKSSPSKSSISPTAPSLSCTKPLRI